MKNKFVLTEEESKRILSLHKERIKEERGVISGEINESKEITNEATSPNDTGKINYKNSTVTLKKKLLLTKTIYGTNKFDYNVRRAIVGGAVFKGTKKGNLVANVTFEDPQTGKRSQRTAYYYCWPNKLRKDENSLKKIRVGDLYYAPGGSLTSDMQRDLKNFDKLCENLKYQNKQEVSPPPKDLLTTAKKCGYSSVDEYKKANWKCPKGGGKKQLTDQEKINKAEKCGHSSWNEYKNSGWKCKTDGGGTNTGGGGTNTGGGGTNTGGGGGGGSQTYPFDYETVLNTIKQKFPDEIINPFEQGDEEEIQLDIVTDKIYTEL